MYNVEDGVDKFIPVDVYIPGCAAHPRQILDGIIKAVEILGQKSNEIELPKQLVNALVDAGDGVDRRELLVPIGEGHGKN